MNITRELEKIGIIVQEKLKIEEKNSIAKVISEKLSINVKELSNSYNELYMRIFNCDMYYAKVTPEFGGVFYFYKNNTIYIDKGTNNINLYLVHEIIHYLQNFSKITKTDNRVGVCQFTDFKILGLGLNEALVQYITAKALGGKVHRVNNQKITICTNSENYYKYMTSLINQILFLIGEKEAVESCITSTDKFENELYNTFEESTLKILKKFDEILEENNKPDRNEDKIIDIYMETQEMIYTTYFNKTYKRLTTIKEVDTQVDKLIDYEKIVGKLLNTTGEDKFSIFKKDMEAKFFNKYIEVNRKKTNGALVVYKSKIYSIWNKIVGFIQRKIEKE